MEDSKKTYRFVNEDKWGADYAEFFIKTYKDVSYTLIQIEVCKGIVFEMELTEQEKDELLSRDRVPACAGTDGHESIGTDEYESLLALDWPRSTIRGERIGDVSQSLRRYSHRTIG